MISDNEVLHVRRVLLDAADIIMDQRGKDYDNNQVGIMSYFIGVHGAAQMVHLKTKRLEAQALQVDRLLSRDPDTDEVPLCDIQDIVNNAADSAIDLINYTSFLFAKLVGLVMAERHRLNEEGDMTREVVMADVASVLASLPRLEASCDRMPKFQEAMRINRARDITAMERLRNGEQFQNEPMETDDEDEEERAARRRRKRKVGKTNAKRPR